jgi:hypothetical protein
MEVTGKIVAILPSTEGVSRMGNKWKKQEYVLETQEQYPKKVCFGLFGADRIDQAAIREGETVTVSFDIESREFNGKWYTNINGWKVEKSSGAHEPLPDNAGAGFSAGEPDMPEYPPLEDDIPF